MTAGGAQKYQQSHRYFLQYANLLPNDIRFEHGDAKLASCPGRHPTSSTPLPRCEV